MNDARRRLLEGLEAGAGARVASSLSGAGAEATILARAHRAHRVRVAWQTGGVAAVAVAVAGAAAVWWGPTGAFEPVAPDPSASASTTLSSTGAPVGDLSWLSGTEWACGDAFDLPQGVTLSDEAASDAGTVSAALVDDLREPGVTVVGPEEESWGATWAVDVTGYAEDLATITTRTVVTQGNRIVGVSNPVDQNVAGGPATASGIYVSLDAEPLVAEVPFPGDCGLTTFRIADGTYELHLVVQLAMGDGSVAQFVDPAGVQTLTYTDQAERLSYMDDALLADAPAVWAESVPSWSLSEGMPVTDAAVSVVGSPPGLQCGDDWTLEEGPYLHDAAYAAYGVTVSAAPVASEVASGEGLTPGQADLDPPLLTWVARVDTSEEDGARTLAQAVAVRDGEVVGAGAVSATWAGFATDLWVDIPRAGACGDEWFEDLASTSAADAVATEIHLVVIRYDMDVPYATWVDPGGALTESQAFQE